MSREQTHASQEAQIKAITRFYEVVRQKEQEAMDGSLQKDFYKEFPSPAADLADPGEHIHYLKGLLREKTLSSYSSLPQVKKTMENWINNLLSGIAPEIVEERSAALSAAASSSTISPLAVQTGRGETVKATVEGIEGRSNHPTAAPAAPARTRGFAFPAALDSLPADAATSTPPPRVELVEDEEEEALSSPLREDSKVEGDDGEADNGPPAPQAEVLQDPLALLLENWRTVRGNFLYPNARSLALTLFNKTVNTGFDCTEFLDISRALFHIFKDVKPENPFLQGLRLALRGHLAYTLLTAPQSGELSAELKKKLLETAAQKQDEASNFYQTEIMSRRTNHSSTTVQGPAYWTIFMINALSKDFVKRAVASEPAIAARAASTSPPLSAEEDWISDEDPWSDVSDAPAASASFSEIEMQNMTGRSRDYPLQPAASDDLLDDGSAHSEQAVNLPPLANEGLTGVEKDLISFYTEEKQPGVENDLQRLKQGNLSALLPFLNDYNTFYSSGHLGRPVLEVVLTRILDSHLSNSLPLNLTPSEVEVLLEFYQYYFGSLGRVPFSRDVKEFAEVLENLLWDMERKPPRPNFAPRVDFDEPPLEAGEQQEDDGRISTRRPDTYDDSVSPREFPAVPAAEDDKTPQSLAQRQLAAMLQALREASPHPPAASSPSTGAHAPVESVDDPDTFTFEAFATSLAPHLGEAAGFGAGGARAAAGSADFDWGRDSSPASAGTGFGAGDAADAGGRRRPALVISPPATPAPGGRAPHSPPGGGDPSASDSSAHHAGSGSGAARRSPLSTGETLFKRICDGEGFGSTYQPKDTQGWEQARKNECTVKYNGDDLTGGVWKVTSPDPEERYRVAARFFLMQLGQNDHIELTQPPEGAQRKKFLEAVQKVYATERKGNPQVFVLPLRVNGEIISDKLPDPAPASAAGAGGAGAGTSASRITDRSVTPGGSDGAPGPAASSAATASQRRGPGARPSSPATSGPDPRSSTGDETVKADAEFSTPGVRKA